MFTQEDIAKAIVSKVNNPMPFLVVAIFALPDRQKNK
jgi:hypothetical protein